jgi:hypothetical protein
MNKYKDVEDLMYQRLDRLSCTPFDFSNRDFVDEDVNALPDAVYRINEANEKNLDYDVRVADHHIWQYHRENGFTKLGIKNPRTGKVQSVLRVMEGQIEAASIINKAYINHNFPGTKMVTGVNFYPFKFAVSMIIEKV